MKVERIVRNRYYHLTGLSEEDYERHYNAKRQIIHRGGDSISAGGSGRGTLYQFMEEEFCEFYESEMGIAPTAANDMPVVNYKERVDAVADLLLRTIEYQNKRLDYLRKINGNMAVRVPLEQSRNSIQHALDILRGAPAPAHDHDQTGEAPD